MTCKICHGRGWTHVGPYRGLDADGNATYDRMPCCRCEPEKYAEYKLIEELIQGNR